jgi:hypothetical protein
MNRQWIAVITLVAGLVLPSPVWAHDGHNHKVIGTVSSIDGNNVMVKATDGKTTMVMLNGKTKITRGKTRLTATDVKVGDRVVAEGPEEKEMVTAETLQLGTAPAPAPKKK